MWLEKTFQQSGLTHTDGAFGKNSEWLKVFNYFCKKVYDNILVSSLLTLNIFLGGILGPFGQWYTDFGHI